MLQPREEVGLPDGLGVEGQVLGENGGGLPPPTVDVLELLHHVPKMAEVEVFYDGLLIGEMVVEGAAGDPAVVGIS